LFNKNIKYKWVNIAIFSSVFSCELILCGGDPHLYIMYVRRAGSTACVFSAYRGASYNRQFCAYVIYERPRTGTWKNHLETPSTLTKCICLYYRQEWSQQSLLTPDGWSLRTYSPWSTGHLWLTSTWFDSKNWG